MTMPIKAGNDRLNLILPPALLDRAKEDAKRRGWTLTAWMERAIKRALPRERQK
jgi:hypothetical protein